MRVTVTMEFELPQEAGYMQAILKGNELVLRIRELDEELRSKLKYSDVPKEEYDIYSNFRQKLNDMLQALGLEDTY